MPSPSSPSSPTKTSPRRPRRRTRSGGHDALSRQAYLGGLAQDLEFTAHVLDGWLDEQETEALARMGSCRADELVDTRARWQAVKDLRQGPARPARCRQDRCCRGEHATAALIFPASAE